MWDNFTAKEREDPIRKHLTEVDVVLQLAEEAAELAFAAVKWARISIGRNPTPLKAEQAQSNLVEEIGDVLNCVDVLGIPFGKDSYVESSRRSKMSRWRSRLRDRYER